MKEPRIHVYCKSDAEQWVWDNITRPGTGRWERERHGNGWVYRLTPDLAYYFTRIRPGKRRTRRG